MILAKMIKNIISKIFWERKPTGQKMHSTKDCVWNTHQITLTPVYHPYTARIPPVYHPYTTVYRRIPPVYHPYTTRIPPVYHPYSARIPPVYLLYIAYGLIDSKETLDGEKGLEPPSKNFDISIQDKSH